MEETETPLELHVRFFSDHSEEARDVTAHYISSASPPSGLQRGNCRICTDSEMRFVLSAPLDVYVQVIWPKRRKLKANHARKSADNTEETVTGTFAAPMHTTNTDGTSARHKKVVLGQVGGLTR